MSEFKECAETELDEAGMRDSIMQRYIPFEMLKCINEILLLLLRPIYSYEQLKSASDHLTLIDKTVDDYQSDITTNDLVLTEELCEVQDRLVAIKVSARANHVGQFTDFVDRVLAGGLEMAKRIFFLDALFCQNEAAINKQFRLVSRLIHPDKCKAYVNEAQREKVNDLNCLVSEAKVELINAPVALETGDAAVSHAKDYLDLAKDYDALEKILRNILPSAELSECRCRLQANSRMTYMLNNLQLYTPESFAISKSKYALLACDFFRSAIIAADRNRSAEGIDARIRFRKYTAEALWFAQCNVESTLYILGAMHLAFENLSDPRTVLNDLNAFLRSTKGEDQTTASSSATAFNELVPYEPRKVRRQLELEYSAWLSRAIVKSDNNKVSILAAEEEIMKTKELGNLYKATGKAAAAVGFLGASASVVTVVAYGVAGITTGGIGVLLLGAFSIFGGVNMMNYGIQLGAEPDVRARLNQIMKDATNFCCSGSMNQFLESASVCYSSGCKHDKGKCLQLFEFKKGLKFNINAKDVVETLLQHKFRADGIACFLNLIAEALISGEIEIRRRTLKELRYSAQGILREIVENDDLVQQAVNLDDKIYTSRRSRSGAFFSWFKVNYSILIDGIPTSYFEDAFVAPFKARLNEMIIIAKTNMALLDIILNDEEGVHIAKENLAELKVCVNSTFQYFSIGKYRSEALQDLINAFGVDDAPPEQALTQAILRLEGSGASILIWGTSIYPVSQIYKSVNVKCLSSVIEVLTGSPHLSVTDIKRILDDRVTDGYANKLYMADENGVVVNYRERSQLIELEKFMASPVWADCVRTNTVSVDLILDRNHDNILSIIYKASFIRTRLYRDGYHFGPREESDIASFNVTQDHRIFVNFDDAGSVDSFFNVDGSLEYDLADNTATGVALQLQLASGYMDKSNGVDGLESIYCYHSAKKCYLNALLMCNSSWLVSTSQVLTPHTDQFFDLIPGLSRDISAEEATAALGYVQCVIKLSQFKIARAFLNTIGAYDQIKRKAKYWAYCVITARHLGINYDAKFCLHRGLDIDPYHPDLLKEKGILERLNSRQRAEDDNENLMKYFRGKAKNVSYSETQQSALSTEFYDIISIDGGGVRGIIPTIWLSELEKIARKPICHMAKMIAGTSTGSIIAGALATQDPSRPGRPVKSAADLVNIYADSGIITRIFKPNSWSFYGLNQPFYHPTGRSAVIGEYVGNARLRDTLCDLTVVATDIDFQKRAKVFSTRAAIKSESDNYLIKDILMASSAAPTYFPSYTIDDPKVNGGHFVDGGLVYNNPSQCALTEALKVEKRDRIRIWSLGTGDLVPQSQSSKIEQGLLYWARKVGDMVTESPEEIHLKQEFGDRYRKWQLWLEDPIPLDCVQENRLWYLADAAEQYIEENIDQFVACARALGGNL